MAYCRPRYHATVGVTDCPQRLQQDLNSVRRRIRTPLCTAACTYTHARNAHASCRLVSCRVLVVTRDSPWTGMREAAWQAGQAGQAGFVVLLLLSLP